MTIKTTWLDRRVAYPGPCLCLALSEAELDAAMKSLKLKPSETFPAVGATTFTFEDNNFDLVCIIAVSESAQKKEGIEVAGLLVHEAVHVWQHHAESIGEAKPGSEQEAYAIQGISQELMMEYARRIK